MELVILIVRALTVVRCFRQRRRLVNKLRNAVRDDRDDRPVREIYDDIVSTSPHASLLPFKSIGLTLRVSRAAAAAASPSRTGPYRRGGGLVCRNRCVGSCIWHIYSLVQ